jgi:hypothetical protein
LLLSALRASGTHCALNHGLKPVAIDIISPPGLHDKFKHICVFVL